VLRRSLSAGGEAAYHGSGGEVFSPGSDVAAASSARHFGRFVILKELGCGSQGMVFHAHDPVLSRDVALKIPRPETLISAQLQARFARESQAMARLSHPHVVTVYEVGQLGPVLYIASQYCPGPTLALWRKSLAGPVDVRLATELTALLAEAVDYVHRQGILHRDIKPGNILLEPAPANCGKYATWSALPFVPKLADFGLARLSEASALGTQSGLALGTPAYMPPEQAEGRQEEIDERTDLYALGAVLYELLTGQPPYGGQSPLEILRGISTRVLRSPRLLRRDVPRDLAAICLKCLEPDKQHRYPTAAALAADLRRFQEGRAVQARPVGMVAATWKRCRRQPVLAAISFALLVSLLAGFGAVSWQWRRAEISRKQAQANYEQARRAVTAFFEKLNGDDVFKDPAVQTARLELLKVAQQYYHEFERAHGSDRQLELNLAEANYRTAFIINTVGSRAEALNLYKHSLPLWERLVARYPSLPEPRYFLVKTHTHIGLLHDVFGRFDVAEKSHEQAQQLAEEFVRRHPDEIGLQNELAASHRALGRLQSRQGEFEQAQQSLEHARRILTTLVEEIPSDWELQRALGGVHYDIGNALRAQSRYEQAITQFHDSRKILEHLVDHERNEPWSRSELADTYQRLGQVFFDMDQLPRAQTYFEKSLQIRQALAAAFPQVTSKQHALADSYMKLASIARAQRRWDDALAAYEQARQIRKVLANDQPGPSLYHRTLAETLCRLAEAYFYRGDRAAAQQWFLESRKIYLWLEETGYPLPNRSDLTLIDRGLDHVQQALSSRTNSATTPAH
jgi:tetratricopeptide (TPR) repeat protein